MSLPVRPRPPAPLLCADRRSPGGPVRGIVGAASILVLLAVLGDPSWARKSAPAASGWPEITAAEKAITSVPEDPEADAVVLIKERDGRMLRQADELVNVMTYHWRMKILTDRGKRYGEVHIRASKGSRVEGVEARTIKPDGTVVPVPPDQIFDKVVFEAGSFRITEKVFNFPAVEPGAILEYRYQRHSNGLFFPDPYYFAGEEYTLRSRVSQGFLAGSSYSILCDLCPPVKPVLGQWREGKQKGQLYSLELQDIPGYRQEALMPPEREVTPRLDMVLNLWKGYAFTALGRQDRFFTDWASVAGYADYDYERAIKDGQSALKGVVQEWTQGAPDAPARVKAVLRHVEDDFRFIPWPIVAGGTRRIETILKDKTADNEEKAVLLIAALKTLGIEAQPVLVASRSYGSVNPKFYSLDQFTHVIAALPGADGTREYLDPTISYAPYGFVPWKDSGASALLLDGKEGTLLTLPVKIEPNATRYEVTVKPRADGTAEATLVATFEGEDAIDVREHVVPASESGRSDWVKHWLKSERPGAVLATTAFENLTDPGKPLVLRATFTAPGLVTVADEAYLVRACVLGCRDTNPLTRSTRTQPFYVDRGWNDEETVTIEPPRAGMTPSQVPPMALARAALATLTMTCSPQDDGSVRCHRQFIARRNRWPASENSSVRSLFDKIVQADRSTVAFSAAGS